jgi:hypothetical protein
VQASSILRAVQSFAPVFGHHPTAVWDAATEGAQKAAEFLPENLAPVKSLVRKHPVLATCAVLALGGLLSAKTNAALAKA